MSLPSFPEYDMSDPTRNFLNRVLEQDISNPYNTTSNRPSLTTAISLFTSTSPSPLVMDTDDQQPFLPSYLQDSAYHHALRSASETDRSGPTIPLALAANPVTVEKIKVPALPTRWVKGERQLLVDIVMGIHVNYLGTKTSHEADISTLRADEPAPLSCGIYYFEVTVNPGMVNSASRSWPGVSIGFARQDVVPKKMAGHEIGTWALCCDDGKKYNSSSGGRAYMDHAIPGEVIGAGINYLKNEIFFTRSGRYLSTAFRNIDGPVYPIVGFSKSEDSVTTNFGAEPFLFEIDAFYGKSRQEQWKDINKTKLKEHKTPSDWPNLILDVLQHEGYNATAEALLREMKHEQELLSTADGEPDPIPDIGDNGDVGTRRAIRSQILSGNIEEARRLLGKEYPGILDKYPLTKYKLDCQQFIEMNRQGEYRAYQARLRDQQLGHWEPEDLPDFQEPLEADPLGLKPTFTDEELSETALAAWDSKLVEFGQDMYRNYAKNETPEIKKTLRELWTLVAYRNPSREPRARTFMDFRSRNAVAEEVDQAIMGTHGRSTRPTLYEIYAKTAVNLEELHKHETETQFITIKDIFHAEHSGISS